jgi:hypothetical protein
MRYIIMLVLIIAGVGLINYSFRIVRTFGTMDWAEKALGPGGSYTAWKLIGTALIIFGVVFLRFASYFGY